MINAKRRYVKKRNDSMQKGMILPVDSFIERKKNSIDAEMSHSFFATMIGAFRFIPSWDKECEICGFLSRGCFVSTEISQVKHIFRR